MWCWTAEVTFINFLPAIPTVFWICQKVNDLALTAFLLSFIGCVSDISATTAVLVVTVCIGNFESRGVWRTSNNNCFRTARCRSIWIVWIGCVSATQAIVIRSICRRSSITAKRRCTTFLAHYSATTAIFNIVHHIYAYFIAAFLSCRTNIAATGTVGVCADIGAYISATLLTFCATHFLTRQTATNYFSRSTCIWAFSTFPPNACSRAACLVWIAHWIARSTMPVFAELISSTTCLVTAYSSSRTT